MLQTPSSRNPNFALPMNRLAGEKVHDRKDVKKFLEPFFASKSPEFYANGIAQLSLRWQEVMNSIGKLISQ
ncbi:hypothetical protein B9Z55_010301 [Caenorhabditis nigoni]|uniref:Uncharacterized protein n=1 Tax=Caenorhabditis nigoni TaxID=1611254 RepID=A0A2G5UF91_9PELO|nr:hypothetical protein B9Z55_010301 [Caenorhabditis nigoni]